MKIDSLRIGALSNCNANALDNTFPQNGALILILIDHLGLIIKLLDGDGDIESVLKVCCYFHERLIICQGFV